MSKAARIAGMGLAIGGMGSVMLGSVRAFDPACMLCVATVGAGLAISRALGVNDALVGVWVGGLLWAAGTWTAALIAKKVMKKWPKARFIGAIYLVVFYAILLSAFWRLKYFENVEPIADFMVNPLLTGMIVGTGVMMGGIKIDKTLRNKKGDKKAFFPFQKVVVPVICLLAATGLMLILLQI